MFIHRSATRTTTTTFTSHISPPKTISSFSSSFITTHHHHHPHLQNLQSKSKSHRRDLSIISIHSAVFPCTLLRFQPGEKSNLFDVNAAQRDDDDKKRDKDKEEKKKGYVLEDAVSVSKENGLVYPSVGLDIPFSNGAVFLPNTFMMQEMVRGYYDEYINDLESTEQNEKENGKEEEKEKNNNNNNRRSIIKTPPPPPPLILSIAKGVPIPTALTLFREHTCRFSLQPSSPMALIELNNLLDAFIAKYADKFTLEDWLDGNQFEDAVADERDEEWMGR